MDHTPLPAAPPALAPTGAPTAGPATAGPATAPASAVVAVLGSGLSCQVGAALATGAFTTLGAPGLVAVRQLVAAIVLLPVARPDLRRLTWAQWWPALLLAAVLATMNLSLYLAIARIGLGLAVTLEFVGPLALALAGARGRRGAVAAVTAAVGVVVLVQPGPSSDVLGIGLALLAATCWAAYILLNRLAGQRLPGVQATAIATATSALAHLPILVLLALDGRLLGLALVQATAAGVLSSAIPYVVDLTALRRVPTSLFGVLMSVHPMWAALVGWVLLGEWLSPWQWLGILVVVGANVLATAGAFPARRGAGPSGPGGVDPTLPVPVPVAA